MDENLKITVIGLLTLVFGTVLASVLASLGITNIIPGLLSFLVAAIIVFTGFRFTDHHLASRH